MLNCSYCSLRRRRPSGKRQRLAPAADDYLIERNGPVNGGGDFLTTGTVWRQLTDRHVGELSRPDRWQRVRSTGMILDACLYVRPAASRLQRCRSLRGCHPSVRGRGRRPWLNRRSRKSREDESRTARLLSHNDARVVRYHASNCRNPLDEESFGGQEQTPAATVRADIPVQARGLPCITMSKN
jgi:hypothetical protein